MKLYSGDAIRKAIPANYATYEDDCYILAYPAPTVYQIPLIPKYGYVFRKMQVLAAKPAGAPRFPGGCFSMKKYIVSTERMTYPKKYREMIGIAMMKEV